MYTSPRDTTSGANRKENVFHTPASARDTRGETQPIYACQQTPAQQSDHVTAHTSDLRTPRALCLSPLHRPHRTRHGIAARDPHGPTCHAWTCDDQACSLTNNGFPHMVITHTDMHTICEWRACHTCMSTHCSPPRRQLSSGTGLLVQHCPNETRSVTYGSLHVLL